MENTTNVKLIRFVCEINCNNSSNLVNAKKKLTQYLHSLLDRKL